MAILSTYKKSVNRGGENKAHSWNKIATIMMWSLFAGTMAYLLGFLPDNPSYFFGGYFQIHGFSMVIWAMVTFFSAIISTYSENYLQGFAFHRKFVVLSFGFTLSVMLLVISNHIIPFIFSWFLMGVFMSKLIGVNANWTEAREASKFTQKYFLASTLFLSIGLVLMAYQSQNYLLNELYKDLDKLPNYSVIISSICIILAAIIQSAIFPFHRWLLSAMTAPTPASALMHAGFVNGAGILLALFSTLIVASNTFNVLFFIGGITAIIAQFTKLLQVNVKQKLACSTIAQMGFMIMQCGLGFFNAAIVHLILHGFYKAYLFLSSGEGIELTKPQKKLKVRITFPQALMVIVYGLLGTVLFIALIGKGKTLDSSIFLTLIVAITVGQMTYNIVKQNVLSVFQRIVFPPVLFFVGILMYGLIFNGVSLLMADMPMVAQALPISGIQVTFGVIFLIGFFVMKLGIYRQVPWLYVKLLNASQPYKKTILINK